jgi:hypothetical protein
MLTNVIIFAVTIAVAVVVAIVKGRKKESTTIPVSRYESFVDKATKEAVEEPDENVTSLIRNHANDSWISQPDSSIEIHINSLRVSYVEVYGVRFDTIKSAINSSKDISDKVAYDMVVIEKELVIARREKFAAERHYEVMPSPFFGDVHVYKDCMIGIATKSGKWADKAPRIAVRIEKDTDSNEVGVTAVYLATDDISAATSVHSWDLNNATEDKDFDKRVIKNKDEFNGESEVLQNLFARIEKYCYLVREKLMVLDNGRWVFKPATDEQLKHIAELNKKLEITVAVGSEEKKAENMFEFMHSSAE